MKIVFVTYHYWPPHFGGELKVSIERFESLVRRGHAVTVLTSGVPGLPGEEVINGVQIKRSPILHDSRFGRGIRRLAFPLWAWSQLRWMDFDILHFGGMGGIGPLTNRFGMELLNHLTHKKGSRAVWVHCLADSEEIAFGEIDYGGKMRNKTLRNIDAIVSVSPALHEDVERFFPGKSKLILYGIHDDLFSPTPKDKREEFRKANRVLQDEVVFSFLGSVGRRKGFDLLIDAFSNSIREHPNWRLWIIGPHNKQESQNFEDEGIDGMLESLKGARERVHFWGRIDDRTEMATILGASDVFVFPSRKEGMGIAPMEAMACGIPAIISRIPGITDQASIEGITGRYIEVNNAEALRTVMVELGTNHELRQIMGKTARQRIVEQFGWEKHIDDWEKLYASLRK